MEDRLQKILARAGVASRRAAERLIASGRVKVNGKVVDRMGAKADPDRDRIEVDGQPVSVSEKPVYFMLNKPAGYVTTLDDPQGRPTIQRWLDKVDQRLFPVGRLDMDVEGLLLLTNDGELAKRLMHPSYHVPKTYRVKVEGHPASEDLNTLASGGIMVDGRPAAPAGVEVIKFGAGWTWLSLTLTEGRNRQVKKMCEAIGHPVMKLKRTDYGALTLGKLKLGEMRPLKAWEIAVLRQSVKMEERPEEKAAENKNADKPRFSKSSRK